MFGLSLKKTNLTTILNRLIKGGFLLVVGVALYYQISSKEEAFSLLDNWKYTRTYFQPLFLILVFVLLPANLSMEIGKWLILIRQTEPISFKTGLKSILAGMTVSVITPNRVGEYAGRILFLKAENNWKGIVASLVGSWSQLGVILSGGMLAILFLSDHILPGISDWSGKLLVVGLIGLILLWLAYFNVKHLLNYLQQNRRVGGWLNKLKSLKILACYDKTTLGKVLGFSVVKYVIYSAQYVLMIKAFGLPVNLDEALPIVGTIFLIQTSVPLPPLVGLLARGEIALLLWGQLFTAPAGILLATFGLWIINIVLPALFGLVFISNVNVLKSLGYEKTSC